MSRVLASVLTLVPLTLSVTVIHSHPSRLRPRTSTLDTSPHLRCRPNAGNRLLTY